MRYPIFPNKNREQSLTFHSVAVSATLDFDLPSTPNIYKIIVNDNSNGYLGSAEIYIGSNTIKVLQDSTTGTLMTTQCIPSIYVSNAFSDGVLRLTNTTTARKIAILALWPIE